MVGTDIGHRHDKLKSLLIAARVAQDRSQDRRVDKRGSRVIRMPLHTLRSVVRLVQAYARLLYLSFINHFSRASITHPGGPIVSLTTYGKRSRTVHLTIESIGRGQIRPSRLILWIDERHLATNLPEGLRRLQQRGLEVKVCANLGPHKKYYPYLESTEIDVPLVTADDDLLYPPDWLKRLVKELHRNPDVIHCYRARVVLLDQNGLANYGEWALACSTDARFQHFAGSGAGVIYPIQLQRALRREGPGFLACCPDADDIWLHVQSIRAGYKIRQIDKKEFPLIYIPGTQGTALRADNMSGGNDRQVKATYRESDICILRREIRDDR